MNTSWRIWLILFVIGFAGNGFSAAPAPTTPTKIKVGLVLDKGGRDDKSFNSAAFQGAKEAEKKLGISLKVVESSDDSAIEPSLRTFAQRGFDLIIAIGFVMAEPVKKVAADFPKIHFLVVDAEAKGPNIRSVLFKEHEGAYLVGAIAALTSKTKSLGFIGGMDVPLIRRFEMGYKAGIQAIDPKAKLVTNYVGSTSDAWRNPTRGKELAVSQYNKNVDVIFVAAGASGLGVFDAAEEMKKYVIGVDSNQNWVKPGRVLTSMIKRIDRAVFETIEAASQGKFEPGTVSQGLAASGIDYALDKYNRSILTPEVEKKANDLKEKIIKGKIKVPDYFDKKQS